MRQLKATVEYTIYPQEWIIVVRQYNPFHGEGLPWSQCQDVADVLGIKRDTYRKAAKEYGALCNKTKVHRNRPAKHRMIFKDKESATRFKDDWVASRIIAAMMAGAV